MLEQRIAGIARGAKSWIPGWPALLRNTARYARSSYRRSASMDYGLWPNALSLRVPYCFMIYRQNHWGIRGEWACSF